MADRPLKSTAREWKGAVRPEQKYRDRKTLTLPTGEKREIFGYGPNKRAATLDLYAKIQRATAEANALTEIDTVTSLMAKLARHKRSVRGRKKKTIHNDLELYKHHIRPHIGDKPISDVTLADLEEIQARLTSAGKYRTAELATILLRSLYKHALRQYRAAIRSGRIALYDLTEDLDAVTRPAAEIHAPNEPWTVDELALFLQEGRKHYDASLRHLAYPLLHTAIASGLRRGELLGLRRQDLVTTQRENGTTAHQLIVSKQLVYYDGKHHPDTPKSRAGARHVPIGDELATVLRAHMGRLDEVAYRNPEWEATDLLFPSFNGRPLDPRNIYRARDTILALIKKHHNVDLPKLRLHELRSLYATYVTRELVQQGKYSPKLVMQLLGHAHPNVALQFYTRVVEEDRSGAVFDPAPPKRALEPGPVPGAVPVSRTGSGD